MSACAEEALEMMSHTDTDLHYMCALSGSKERAVLTGGGVDFEPFASPISKEICGLQMKDSTSTQISDCSCHL